MNWTYASGSSNTVVLQLSSDSSGYIEDVLSSDNGSYTVPSSDLAGFIPGSNIRIILTRISYQDAVAADGRKYAIATYSREIDYHSIVP